MHEYCDCVTTLGFRMDKDDPDEVQRWAEQPPTEEELEIVRIADWGTAEDWSDWADVTR